MWLDLSPLRSHNYRLLFTSQLVSSLGTMMTYVALPYQVHQLTHSPFWVGALGAVELLPVVLLSLWGGVLADRLDRKRLLWGAELLMSVGALGLLLNSLLPHPSLPLIFALAFVMQAANALHRPTLEALRQAVVEPEAYGALGALTAFQGSFTMIIGPALGGLLIAAGSTAWVYACDLLSFALALICIAQLRLAALPAEPELSPLDSLREGLHFAGQRPVLLGSYFVDVLAMTFAFPLALFPLMSEAWGGASAVGLLYAAMPVGSLLITLVSGRLSPLPRHGAMVVLAAAAWGATMVGLGFASGLYWALAWLVLAGMADMVSGLFRSMIWNETIPNAMRGRLAGLEMLSYLSGPLLGNLRAGLLAEQVSLRFSIVSGGLLCILGVVVCALCLPAFWRYHSGILRKA